MHASAVSKNANANANAPASCLSPLTSASSPSPRLAAAAAARTVPRDDTLLSAPWASLSTSPAGASSRSVSGSPSRADSLRSQTVTPNPFNLPSLPYREAETGESVHESSPDNRRPGSSAYYTTAWGSPYAAPSPRALSLSLSQKNAVVGRESSASSPRSMRSGVDHNPSSHLTHQDNNNNLDNLDNDNDIDGHPKPSSGDGSARNLYSSGILNRSPGRDPVGRKGGKSIKDFTQDWINQYLSGQSRSERSNWLSDDSGSEAPSFFTAQNHFADDDWLGLEDDSRNEDLLKTPTLADFATRKKGPGYAESATTTVSSNPARRKPKDHVHKRTDTLKQEDFWGFAYDKDPEPIITMENETTDSLPPLAEPEVSQTASSPVEKPLPPPPEEKTKEKDYSSASSHTEPGEPGEPESAATGSAEPEPAETSTPQPQEQKPPLTRATTATLQRSRKKIPWKGKACIIALPLEDKRGSEEFGYRLLTPQDVEARLKNWEDEGHDIRGFRVSTPVEDPIDPDALELGGLSRPSFPDSDELDEDYRAGRFGVRIPNRAEWDSYVAFLQEEKLRALGVSLGEEEGHSQEPEDDDGRRNLLSSVSPASAAMSQMAPFPGLIASPPIPTASAASNNPLAIPHPFSPHLNQSANSPGIGSLASPASQFSVQTPFLGVDHHQHLMGGYPLPFQPTPPAHGSFTPQSFLNARQTGHLPGTLPNLTSMLSPVSPLNDPSAFQAALDHNNKEFEDQFHPGMSENGTGHHHHQIPRVQTPTENDNFHSSNVEIAHPTPRGHSRGQNLSETLQKGLDQIGHSDYHLERSIERQLDEDDRDAGHDGYNKNPGLLTSRWAMPNSTAAAAYSQHDGSDIDTNPSLSGVPHGHGPLANDIAWHESKPSHGSHRSKLSASTFNVEAKEFDPVGGFSPQGFPPQNFPFQNNAFQFQGMDSSSSLFTFGAGQDFQSGGAAAPPTEAFNVTAPAFNPSGIESHQKHAPSGEFKFSSASFNVEAPAFNPGGSMGSTGSIPPPPSGERTKIFGDIDFAEISKPTKQSKAIPIVRPDEIENDNKDSKDEDKDNKDKEKDIDADVASLHSVPTDRNKRARHDTPSDEEVDMSVPTRALNEAKNSQGTQESSAHTHADGKENAVPEDETVEVKRPSTMERRDTPVSEASTWAPPDGKDQLRETVPGSPVRHQAPGTGATKRGFEMEQQPVTELEDSASTPVAQAQDDDDDDDAEGEDDSAAEQEKSTILSPDAKPFEFRAAVQEFVPPSEKPSVSEKRSISEKPASTSKPAKGLSSLMSSRYAVASPPSSPKDKPLPPEPPRPEPAQKDQPAESKTRQLDESDDRSTDEEDINAIMEQLNEDSDVGVERLNTPQPATKAPGTVVAPSKEKRHAPIEDRSEAPSPSPGREPASAVLEIPKLDFEAQSHTSGTPSKMARSSVRQLGTENDHVSDWDDVISSAEDEKLMNRSKFFDRRINDLVGSVVEERLTPLERALGMIQQSMTSIASGAQNKWALRSTSATGEDSDADDEDEYETSSVRARSPLNQKDRKLDKLKGIIQDALAARAPVPVSVPAPVQDGTAVPDASNEIMQLRQNFAELQEFTKQNLVSQDPSTNMRAMIQETIAAQMSLQAARPSSDADEIGADSLMLQIDGLKGMLRVADDRAEQEYKMRRESQDAIAELQRLLKVAEEDAARHSTAAESAEARFLAFKEENLPRFEEVHARSSGMSEEREALRLTLAEISSKNITLQGTLDEHRVSGESWKRESEKNKAQLEQAQGENKKLLENIDHLRMRLEDGVNIRKKLSDRFDRLQDEMANVTRDIAHDQAAAKEVRAAHSREVKLRERLEVDMRELEQQEREAAKLKFIFAQSQQENARLEDLVGRLRLENQGLDNKAARFEREFNDARETSRVEIQRTKTSLEADVEAANSQVNIVRAELEGQIIRLQGQQENIRLDADTARERYEMLLEEANEAKANAIASKEMALDDQRRLHERGLNDLRERHARALHNSSEDKQRKESYMSDRLELSESKANHLQERVQHLEEKLEITQSAARAAAEAASKGGIAVPNMPAPAMFSKSSDQVPEKISPQALRESILVLQDQLQQREARIDELEQEASSVDKNAPTRVKEQDTEITWLRELLGVRIDDLQDIITTLSQPSFNQHSVRDAAIRLRANLQMQLQERERAHDGHGFPALPSISDLAATPRALPLAAAAAWGNWRRTGSNASANSNANANEETPSKTKSGSFLSGLLTPPGSQARQSSRAGPSAAQSGSRRTSETRPLRGFNPTPRPLSARTTTTTTAANTIPEPPTTPPLLRRSSYDHDAEPADYEHGSVADEMVSASPKESPKSSPVMDESFESQSNDSA